MVRWTKIGIVAGGGNLPIRLAQTCRESDGPYFLVRLAGLADDELAQQVGETISISEVGKIFRTLHENKCDAVVLAGLVQRPDFKTLRPDWRGAALLPKLIAAATKGDGAILSTLVDAFEAEGFLVVGADEILRGDTAGVGAFGRHHPTTDDFLDIVKARAVIEALGKFDIGQGAVVFDTQVLAIEAVEGTDLMLDRCAAIRLSLNNQDHGGVLVKIPKPGQELRVDLPTIGPETVRRAAMAKLSGIAVATGAALLVDPAQTIEIADAAGLFVYGFDEHDQNLRAAQKSLADAALLL